jgi:hypothetical protein
VILAGTGIRWLILRFHANFYTLCDFSNHLHQKYQFFLFYNFFVFTVLLALDAQRHKNGTLLEGKTGE